MSDTRARVAYTKPINLLQLIQEAGGPLVTSATEVVSADGALSQAALQAAVDAHVANPSDADRGVELRSKADAALTANATFLGLASPTNAQTLSQVQTLTRECNALIRLVINKLDSTTGT